MSTKKKTAAEDTAMIPETPVPENTDTDTAPAVEAAPVPYAVEARRNYIYIGPTLPRGMLKSNTLFTGTMTEVKTYLHTALEKYPDVIDLVVPTDRLAESRHMLRGGRWALRAKYDRVTLAIKAGMARKE